MNIRLNKAQMFLFGCIAGWLLAAFGYAICLRDLNRYYHDAASSNGIKCDLFNPAGDR